MAEKERRDRPPKRFREGYAGVDAPEGATLVPPQEPAAWIPEKAPSDAPADDGAGSPPQQREPHTAD